MFEDPIILKAFSFSKRFRVYQKLYLDVDNIFLIYQFPSKC